MLIHMLLRIFSYSIASWSILPKRYVIYAYWIPQTMVSALFLMTCLSYFRAGKERETEKRPELLLLLPPAVLSVIAMTNDLHGLVYKPSVPLSTFIVGGGTYSWGIFFYFYICGWRLP